METLIITGFDENLNYVCSRSATITLKEARKWVKWQPHTKYFSVKSQNININKEEIKLL